jgi:hypothetical protein
MNHIDAASSDSRNYDTADQYVLAASIRLTGRTLRRWCDDNPHLAELLGRLRTKGKDLFDLRTAPRFREAWIEAERKKSADIARAAGEAARKIRRRENEQ